MLHRSARATLCAALRRDEGCRASRSIASVPARLQKHTGPLLSRRLQCHQFPARCFCGAAVSEAAVPSLDLQGSAPGAAAAAAEHAFERLGVYRGNKRAWQSVTAQLLAAGDLANLDAPDFLRLVHALASRAELTQGSFWDSATEEASKALAEASLEELLELCSLYARIRCYHEKLFSVTTRRLMTTWSVFVLEPAAFAELLSAFSRAGRSDERVSKMTTLVFNQAHERLTEEAADFEVDEIISIIESMARFGVKSLSSTPVLQAVGRAVLHPNFASMPAEQMAAVCTAYAELGYRHDTIFKTVLQAIVKEAEGTQRARSLGTMTGSQSNMTYDEAGELVPLKFATSDIALVANATLTLKMHRGSTSWCSWGDYYEELIDILERRATDGVTEMGAKPLASAAFVLGRAGRGTDELCKAMFDHMMDLLERGANFSVSEEPPQHELAKLLDGIVMMGSTRKKELDAQWLMQWACSNYMTLNLGDLIRVNRNLVRLGIHEQDYLKIFVDPFLTDRVQELTKEDILQVTHTYNGARISDDDMGRHLFWSMGLQFQKLNAASKGVQKRPEYVRLG